MLRRSFLSLPALVLASGSSPAANTPIRIDEPNRPIGPSDLRAHLAKVIAEMGEAGILVLDVPIVVTMNWGFRFAP